MKQLAAAFIALAACCAQAEQIAPDLFVYPNKGQTAEQQSKDRDECIEFARWQTGFEPASTPPAGIAVDAAEFVLARTNRAQAEYLHIRNGCMQQRGYVVR